MVLVSELKVFRFVSLLTTFNTTTPHTIMSAEVSPSPPPSLSIRSPSSSRTSLDAPASNTSTLSRPANARRNRAALRDYYGIKSSREDSNSNDGALPTAQQQTPTILSELDRDGFEAGTYVKNLLERESLENVLKVEGALVNEIRGLDGERKALVYDNYSKLIAATDTIQMVMHLRRSIAFTNSQSSRCAQTWILSRLPLRRSHPQYHTLLRRLQLFRKSWLNMPHPPNTRIPTEEPSKYKQCDGFWMLLTVFAICSIMIARQMLKMSGLSSRTCSINGNVSKARRRSNGNVSRHSVQRKTAHPLEQDDSSATCRRLSRRLDLREKGTLKNR